MARRARPHFWTPQRSSEIWGILLFFGSLFLLMCLLSFHSDDSSFFTSRPSVHIHNLGGMVGASVAGAMMLVMGVTSYLLVGLGFLWSLARFQGKPPQRLQIKILSTILFCVAVSSLLYVLWVHVPDVKFFYRGGMIGTWAGNHLLNYFGWWGAVVVLFTVGLLCLLLSTELEIWPVLSRAIKSFKMPEFSIRTKVPVIRGLEKRKEKEEKKETPILIKTPPPQPRPLIKEPVVQKESRTAPVKEPVSRTVSNQPYQLPSLDLLDHPAAAPQPRQGKESVEAVAKILEEALRDFGIDAKVAEVEVGPVITRYEIEPAPGVKVQKITGLSDDLALVLKAPSVRIIAPIPGKARVGIEVPNAASSGVTLREVLESPEFKNSTSKLTLAIGKDAAGHPLVADLGEMPHLLIAGTTGSGKTVCMNALITSILFNSTPDQVRFIMVDPKMVELISFNGLPHLILPVVTEAKQVSAALHWVVQEMETRYRLFNKLEVRNIDTYHQKLAEGQLPKEEIPEHLPYLVIIVDELADLMMVAQAEIEKTIRRLAQLSRAVGIHMVLATQRPSVDVLTGVIKANFPSRISFQVASKVDSRTVLDTIGADKLLGKGDLLFMQPGSSRLVRAQGTYVTDQEIERVVSFIKSQRTASYDMSIIEAAESKWAEGQEQVRDVLYDEAVRIIVEIGQASVSLLQRRMRLGYGRAARILDMMEQEGIVGPIRGAKPREVYLKEVPNDPTTTVGKEVVR